MKLTAKLVLVILAVFGGLLAANIWILNSTIATSFERLEREHARADGRRILEALRREAEHLDPSVQDWAFWTDTYNFAEGNFDAYIQENLYPDTLRGLGVNALYVLDRQGAVLWSMLFDLDTGSELSVAELPGDRFPADHPILKRRRDDGPVHGLIKTQAGAMLIAAAPILTNERQGPPAGTMVVGRLLTSAMQDRLKHQTGLDFSIVPLDTGAVGLGEREAAGEVTEADSFAIEESGENTLIVRSLLHDLEGSPAAMVRAVVARDITQIGEETEETAILLMILVGVVMLVAMGILIRTTVVAPVGELTRHVAAIGTTGRLSEVQMRKRTDEFGLLAGEFDRMVRQLKVVRERLMEQSYYSGKAESIAGVMHNVRNALNPVNLVVWDTINALKDRRSDNLKRSIAELRSEEISEERRAKLWTFLEQSVARLDDEQRRLLADLEEITEQHRIVDAILVEHNSFSRFERLVEDVPLADVLREASQVISRRNKPRVQISLPSSPPSVHAHRILLSQVLSNLFMNAQEAIAATGRDSGEISVSWAPVEGQAGAKIRLTVADGGEGIAADNLTKIFERGYSSRTYKKGGFGLHWCANCLIGMGGRISVTSDGPGRGAAFHVELPASVSVDREAAQ